MLFRQFLARAPSVDMTMTTPVCPIADMLVEQARLAVQRVCPEGTEVRLQLVWEPIWNPSMMSGTAREFFGWTSMQ